MPWLHAQCHHDSIFGNMIIRNWRMHCVGMSPIDLECSIMLLVQQAVLYSISEGQSFTRVTRLRVGQMEFSRKFKLHPNQCRIMPGNQENLVTHVQFSEILKMTSYGNLRNLRKPIKIFSTAGYFEYQASGWFLGFWVSGNLETIGTVGKGQERIST